MNSILTIRPYRMGTVWVFDDDRVNIRQEPFVGDINKMIDTMLIKNDLIPSEPFTAMFSAVKFPGHMMHMKHMCEESGGNWYSAFEMAGWLCPALFKYFEKAPSDIYVRAEE